MRNLRVTALVQLLSNTEMKPYLKEIIICAIAIIIAAIAVSYFSMQIQERKQTEAIHIALFDNPEAVATLYINKPQTLSNTLKAKQTIENMLSDQIPPVFLQLAKLYDATTPSLVLFYPKEIVFVAKANGSIIKKMSDSVFAVHYHNYRPVEHKKGPITYYYYPETDNQFLGYFHYKGIMAVSYSKKHLEDIGDRLVQIRRNKPTDRNTEESKVAFELRVNTDYIKSDSIIASDSTIWKFEEKTFPLELSFGENTLCFQGIFNDISLTDSILHDKLKEAFSVQLKELFPESQPETALRAVYSSLLINSCIAYP
ncbi:hypothetical protein LJC57_03785 [Parabacteroides sp. OttesenSCG-928-G07]|nr:hypothetical protein [Parabacteroides sp. OttesenSCG-928-G07]